jgi:hypothetical protein
MSKNRKRVLLSMVIIVLLAIISNIIVRNSNIAMFSMFETSNLFTYFGVLIGFSLTVYTFGLSMVSDVKTKINEHEKLNPQQKEKMLNSLISGFVQIKEDIWHIFFSIILIIIFGLLKAIPNPFGWDVEKFKIPETINLTLFITTTISMWDIMKTLFNLGEINLELNKNQNTSSNTRR